MSRISQIKNKALEEGLLVDPAYEKKYADENHFQLRRLSNGAKILAIERIIEDSRISTVTFQMMSGGYFDPKGYEGAHHFLEHLFF